MSLQCNLSEEVFLLTSETPRHTNNRYKNKVNGVVKNLHRYLDSLTPLSQAHFTFDFFPNSLAFIPFILLSLSVKSTVLQNCNMLSSTSSERIQNSYFAELWALSSYCARASTEITFSFSWDSYVSESITMPVVRLWSTLASLRFGRRCCGSDLKINQLCAEQTVNHQPRRVPAVLSRADLGQSSQYLIKPRICNDTSLLQS